MKFAARWWGLIGMFAWTSPMVAEEASVPWEDLTCVGADRGECERLAADLESQERHADALILYTRSCRAGGGEACAKVAFHLQREGNASDAYTTFHRACTLGHGPSCFYQGTLAMNDAEKTNAYARACEHGIHLACERIGKSTPESKSLPLAGGKCIDEDGRNPSGCHLEGVAFLKAGKLQAAQQAFQAACGGGIAASCFALGELNRGEDLAAAEAYYRQACSLGLGQGCYHVAKNFNRNSIAEQTISFLKQGCHLGHSASCFSLRAAEREAEGRSTAAGH